MPLKARTGACLLPVLAFLALGSCTPLFWAPHHVVLTNATARPLSLEARGGGPYGIPDTGPLTLPPGQSLTLTAERSVYLEFTAAWDGRTWSGNSGYTEDYTAYGLRFSDGGGTLRCELVHRRDGTRTVELAESP